MARDRNRLREFQEALSLRLREATELPQRQSRLAVLIGDRGYLLNLDDISEVAPVGIIAPVPLTQPWFLGVTNVRGSLFAVTELTSMLRLRALPDHGARRLILLGQRLSKQRAGLVVSKVVGLRLLDDMKALDIESRRPWETTNWQDRDGATWVEIDLGRLAADADFLQVVH